MEFLKAWAESNPDEKVGYTHRRCHCVTHKFMTDPCHIPVDSVLAACLGLLD